jgi:hypothetical protein
MKLDFLIGLVKKVQDSLDLPEQKAIAGHYLLSRLGYEPPEAASAAEVEAVLFSAALAAAYVQYPRGCSVEDAGQRTLKHRLMLASRNEKVPIRGEFTLDELANLVKSAQQARENFFHTDAKLLNKKSLLIVENWISDNREGLSLAECTAEAATIFLSELLDETRDPKNFKRDVKDRFGLISFKKPRIREILIR